MCTCLDLKCCVALLWRDRTIQAGYFFGSGVTAVSRDILHGMNGLHLIEDPACCLKVLYMVQKFSP